MNVTFRPIDTWPADTPLEGQWSRFRASYSDTLDLLDRELWQLDARNVVIQVALREDQIRLDGLPKSNATAPTHPGVILAFDSKHGPLKYASGAFHHWQDNLRAIALGLESLRRVDRYGITKRGEQYTGWKALPSGSQVEKDLELGRKLIAEHGSLKAAKRATHPDAGGDADDFRAVMAAGGEA